MKPISKYADVYTVREFNEHVGLGLFVPNDGSGFYATWSEESDLSVWSEPQPPWATHVTWYNK